MKKLLLILLCFPFIGFGQSGESDSSIAFNYFLNAKIANSWPAAIIEVTKAIQLTERSVDIFSPADWRAHLLSQFYSFRADAFLRTDQIEDAINDLNDNHRIRSKYWDLNANDYFLLGEAYFLNMNMKLAIIQFSSGLELEENTDYRANRALCYFWIKKYDNCIKDFSLVLDSEISVESKYKCLLFRAKSYLATSRYHSAISDLNELLKMDVKSVESAEFMYLRGCSYAMLNSTLACRDFKEACQLGYENACVNISDVCSQKEDNATTSSRPSNTNSNKVILPIINEGNMKYVYIKIGNKKYKYLIDTGASDMVINSDIEQDLLNTGFLRLGDYSQPRIYEIANGQEIKLEIAKLNYITIDSQQFYDIDIAIGNQHASLLLGMSFLNRFYWRFTDNTLELSPK